MAETSSSKKVLLNSIIYSASGIITKCVSFFLMPLYTAYLTTEDYGITSLATSFANVMIFLVSFSIFSAIKRFYVDLKEEPEKLKRFYGSTVTFVFLSNIVFAIILTLGRSWVSQVFFSGVDYFPVIFTCLISLAFHCQQMIFDNIMKSQQKALKSSICSLGFFLLNVFFNILFIVIFKMGAFGSILGGTLAYVIYTAYFIAEMLVSKKIVFCLDWGLLKSALKYSIPIIPHNLSANIAVFVSKILIGGTASLASVGIYAVASQFTTIADTVQYYVSNAYGPWLYEKLHLKEASYKHSIRNTSRILSGIIGAIILGIALFAQDYIILFVDKAYVGAWVYVPFMIIVYVIKIVYFFYVEVLFYYKKASRLLFISTLSSSITNVVLSFLIIPMWGIYGAILADILAMFIRVSIVVGISMKFEDVGLRVKDFAINVATIITFVFAGLALSFFKYQSTFSICNFAYKILIFALYCCYVAISNKKMFIGYVNSLKKRKKS